MPYPARHLPTKETQQGEGNKVRCGRLVYYKQQIQTGGIDIQYLLRDTLTVYTIKTGENNLLQNGITWFWLFRSTVKVLGQLKLQGKRKYLGSFFFFYLPQWFEESVQTVSGEVGQMSFHFRCTKVSGYLPANEDFQLTNIVAFYQRTSPPSVAASTLTSFLPYFS